MAAAAITRKTALALLGAGAVGALGGCRREELIEELDRDAEAENPFRVMRRPYAPEPGREVSVLGYGGTRLPTLNRNEREIDFELGGRLIDFAYRHGVNWFDTGWFYHQGTSEKFLGEMLSRYPRDSYFISDKLAPWCVKTLDDAKRIFNEQLKRLRTDYFDVYMIHSLSNESDYRKMTTGIGLSEFLDEQRKEGRVRHFGFSFHGRSDLLKKVLEEGEGRWETVIALVNALEHRTNPDSLRVLGLLNEHRVPVFAMEPLGGGRVCNLSAEARARLAAADPGSTPAKWGYRYALSCGRLQCVISGMGHMKWLDENVRTLSEELFRPFSESDSAVYGEVMDAFASRKTVPCTGCRYCVPCPYGVAIPEVFAWYNSFASAGELPSKDGENASPELRRRFLASYSRAVPPNAGPDRCINCRKCTIGCPQFIFKVPDEMRKIAAYLADVRSGWSGAAPGAGAKRG